MVVHAFKPSTQEAETDLYKFKISLVRLNALQGKSVGAEILLSMSSTPPPNYSN